MKGKPSRDGKLVRVAEGKRESESERARKGKEKERERREQGETKVDSVRKGERR